MSDTKRCNFSRPKFLDLSNIKLDQPLTSVFLGTPELERIYLTSPEVLNMMFTLSGESLFSNYLNDQIEEDSKILTVNDEKTQALIPTEINPESSLIEDNEENNNNNRGEKRKCESSELDKLNLKRLKNRIAANRCRRKKMERIEELEKRKISLEEEREELKRKIDETRDYLADKLRTITHQHQMCNLEEVIFQFPDFFY